MKEYKYKINGNTYNVAIGDIVDNMTEVLVNGTPYKVELEKKKAPVTVVAPHRPSAAPRTATGEKVVAKAAAGASAYEVKAPLPGTILSINVKPGDVVKADDTVVVLEAMKMENAIHAGRDGKVSGVSVAAGDAVLEGAVLISIE